MSQLLEGPPTTRKPQRAQVDDLFGCSLAFDNIFDHIGPGDLFRFSKTCLAGSDAVKAYIHHAFNINALLLRYFSDPDGFRLLQANTGTIISGSTALQFMDRTYYPDSDLDLYVTREHAFTLHDWLQKEGYTYHATPNRPKFGFDNLEVESEPDLDDEGYSLTSLLAVFEFRKGGKRVQIIAVKLSTFHAILSFHSTCVMNFITYEAAYSLYPRATFDSRLTVSVRNLAAPKDYKALDKYIARGWAMTLDTMLPYGLERMKCILMPNIPRCVLDKHVWRLPLSKLDVPPRKLSRLSPEITFDPVVVNAWSLSSSTNRFEAPSQNLIASGILKYKYTWADKRLQEKIASFLSSQGKLEWARKKALGDVDESEWDNFMIWWDAALYPIFQHHFTANGGDRSLTIAES